MDLLDEPAARQSLLLEDVEEDTQPFPEIAPDDAGDSGRDSSGPDEALFDNILGDGESSPGTSHGSDDDLSELPESRRTSYVSTAAEKPAPLTPTKQRSPFRNPSSVRAIQLDITPPHLLSSAHYRKYRMSNASRNSTPKSTRSFQSTIRSPKSSPTKNAKKEYPLVLLHVTLLPVTCPYSQAAMEAVLPPYIIENWKLLREKVTSTMSDRGILIPHPREDYDLLEERFLESVELKSPRILKCGHFHLTPEEEADIEASDDEYASDGDYDTCQDCGRRIRDGRFGAGAGERRWSIKVYASNGLMRAGAWAAAWREMERVDVEILPWLDDEMRRQLDLRQEEENQHVFAETGAPDSPETMDEERRREIYGEVPQPVMKTSAGPRPSTGPTPVRRGGEVPLTDLLVSCLRHLMQDRKNLAIALLSICVLHLAFRMGSVAPVEITLPESQHESITTSSTTSQSSQDAEVMSVMQIPTVSSLDPMTMSEAPVAEISVQVKEGQQRAEDEEGRCASVEVREMTLKASSTQIFHGGL